MSTDDMMVEKIRNARYDNLVWCVVFCVLILCITKCGLNKQRNDQQAEMENIKAGHCRDIWEKWVPCEILKK